MEDGGEQGPHRPPRQMHQGHKRDYVPVESAEPPPDRYETARGGPSAFLTAVRLPAGGHVYLCPLNTRTRPTQAPQNTYEHMSTTAAKQPTKHIDELHFEHRVWLNNLKFCKEEITIFSTASKLVQRNTGKELLAELEHFQNQYIREKEVMDELRHDIKAARTSREGVGGKTRGHRRQTFGDHAELRDRMGDLRAALR